MCRNVLYPRLFSKRTIALHVILTWIIIITLLIPILLRGEKSFIYEIRLRLCIIEIDGFPMWYILMFIAVIMSCILLCCICYLKIVLKVRESKRRVGAGNVTGTQVHFKKELSLYKTMFTVFAAYLILSFPGAIIVIFITLHYNVPEEVYQWCIYLVFCNSVVNGIIYGITNSQFQRGYKKCIDALLCRKASLFEINTSDTIISM